MHISYQFFLSLMMTFVFVGVIVIIYSRCQDRKTTANVYSLLVSSIAMWCACMSMFYYVRSHDLLLFWVKAQFFSGSLIASSLILFSIVYPSVSYKIPFYRRILVFVPSLIFYYLCFFTPYIIKDVATFRGTIGWVGGTYYMAWYLYFALACVFALASHFQKFKKSTGTIRDRLRYVITAFIIGIVLSSIPSILMPLFFKRFELYWIGPPLILTWIVFVAYVIFKKPLMEIPEILKKSVLYSLLLSVLALFQFVSVVMVRQFFPEITRVFPLSAFLVSIVFLIILLVPFKNFVSYYVDKYIFGENYFKIVKENELLKEEAEQAEKFKSLATLFNRIIFEIKNPLTTLKGYSYCLAEKAGDKEFLTDFAVTLRNEVDRINNLVNHLADYNKPSALVFKEVDIFDFIDETLSILKNNFIKENVSVVKKYQKQDNLGSKTLIDKKQLRQAFLNIIVNSIDAMPNGGNIRIEAARSDQSFVISVCDSGSGIPKNMIGKIFEPFFTTKSDNQGLGLAVSLGIIENHSGTINIESEEGIGTEVVIRLPIRSRFELENTAIRIG